jgi:hypothetical protein
MDFIHCVAIKVKCLPFGDGISCYYKAKITVNSYYVGPYWQYHSQFLDPEDENRTDFDFVFSLRTGDRSCPRNKMFLFASQDDGQTSEKITQNRNILSGLLNQNQPLPYDRSKFRHTEILLLQWIITHPAFCG